MIAEQLAGPVAVLTAAPLFAALFIVGMAMLVSERRRSQRRFNELVPWLADRYGIPQQEVALFRDWREMSAVRRSLPNATALAVFHDQPRATGRPSGTRRAPPRCPPSAGVALSC